MKQLSPRSGVELLFVDVPEGIRVTLVDNEYRVILLSDKTIIDLTVSGQWELLGRAGEILETHKREILERDFDAAGWAYWYKDYENEGSWIKYKYWESWDGFLRFHKIEGSAVVLRKVL